MIRDDSAKVQLLGAKWCGYTHVLVAEALALKEVIRAAKFLGIKKLEIEDDNLRLMNCLTANWKVPWKKHL